MAGSTIHGWGPFRYLNSHVANRLARLVTAPPAGDGWVYERKLDGLRWGGLFAFSTVSPLLTLAWPADSEDPSTEFVLDYFGIHRLEFFLRHLLHPHAAGMKGEAFRLNGFARAQHGGDFGLHCGVGAGDNLPDSITQCWRWHKRDCTTPLLAEEGRLRRRRRRGGQNGKNVSPN